MNRPLIFDVGMHNGKDTRFYLDKDFDVVAIEANPTLVERAKGSFREELASGRLALHDIAIAAHDGEIGFYINDQHDDWGTISSEFAERNRRLGTRSTLITVKCRQLGDILSQYEMPYYMKIDIEGADTLCLEALRVFPDRPRYLSIEMSLTSFDEVFGDVALLWELGYRSFKIVNQAANVRVRCPYPPLEGQFVDYRFDGTCSGPFGEEAPGAWMTVEETLMRYRRILLEQRFFGAAGRYYRTILHRVYEAAKRAPAGWYDLHARHEGESNQ